MKQTNNKLLFVLAILAFAFSFVLRWWSYNQTPYANGWDSYFYLDQLKSLVESGHLHSDRISILYPILYFFYLFTNDYVTTYKIAATFFVSLFTILSIFYVYKLSKNFWVTLLVGSFLLFSPHLTFFGAQYLKNIIGLCFLICFILALQNKNKLLPIILFLVCLFSHKLIGVLAILYAVYHIGYLKINWVKKNPFPSLFLIVVMTWGIIISVFLSTGLFSHEISLSLQFHPLNLYEQYQDEMTIWWTLEFFISAFIFFIALLKPSKGSFVLLSLSLFLLFPFLNWDLQGISLRFILIFFLLVPLLIAKINLNKYITIGLSLLFLGASFFSWKNYNPEKQDPNYAFYEVLSDRISPILDKKQPTIIIAHKSLAEFLSFNQNRDVLPWAIPKNEITENVWRLGYGLSKQNLNYYNLNATSLPGQYFLIKESNWQTLLNKLKTEDPILYKELTTWRNPFNIR